MARRLVPLSDEEISKIQTVLDLHVSCYPSEYSAVRKLQKKLEDSQRRITRSSAKSKGRVFQQWVCRWVSELLGIPYNQSDDDCEIHSREMGQQGTDVALRGTARALFPFDIEAKAVKSLSLQDAVEQADSNAGKDRFGVVFYKQTTQKPLVIFSLDTFRGVCFRLMEPMFTKFPGKLKEVDDGGE